MRKFVLKVALFLMILFLIDRSFIFFKEVDQNIFSLIANEKMGKMSKLSNARLNSDILIVGSSHAQFGISTRILEKQLKVTALNMSYGGGSNVGLQLNLLKKLIKNKNISPKTIVFAMDVFTLNAPPLDDDESQGIFFQEQKTPILNFDHYFVSFCKLYGLGIPRYLKKVVKKMNYQLPFFEKQTFNLSMFNKFDGYTIEDDGWVRANGILNKKYIRYSTLTFNPDKKSMVMLDDYVRLCEENNIKLIFVQVPEHQVSLNSVQKYIDFNHWITGYVSKTKLKYLDYNNSQKFPVNEDKLFLDSDHLNAEGAELFTLLLSENLQLYLND
jgi:hypothetical protein